MSSWNLITKEAKTEGEMKTAYELALFHFINPNGLYQKADLLYNKAMELVKQGKIPFGYLLGTFDINYNYKALRKLVDMKKPRYRRVSVAIMMLKVKIEEMENKLNKLK